MVYFFVAYHGMFSFFRMERYCDGKVMALLYVMIVCQNLTCISYTLRTFMFKHLEVMDVEGRDELITSNGSKLKFIVFYYDKRLWNVK